MTNADRAAREAKEDAQEAGSHPYEGVRAEANKALLYFVGNVQCYSPCDGLRIVRARDKFMLQQIFIRNGSPRAFSGVCLTKDQLARLRDACDLAITL